MSGVSIFEHAYGQKVDILNSSRPICSATCQETFGLCQIYDF